MYQVLARKWRPQSFDELVGQQHVARTLANAIRTDRLAHTYLFAGIRGIGKTTVARLLAKCLNCEKGPTVTPCNRCASCVEIAEGRSMDVMEIDAASRTKVEQTRELLEVVSYAPARDRYRILIIDEAHMLSKSSFNALLKTLEEPPPRTVFILATTEIHKLLPTILSRCQVFEFRRVTVRESLAHLRKICDAEKIQVSDATLERVARSGEGSVRDALSVLERMIASFGDEIPDDEALRILGAVRTEVLVETVRALAARDAAAGLAILDTLVNEGHDLLHFWSEMISVLRDLLLLRTIPEPGDLLSRTPEEAQALLQASDGLTREDLTRIFQILADLEQPLRSSAQPRFLFESALIRLAGLGAVRPIEEILAGLGPESAGSPPGEVSGPPPSPRVARTGARRSQGAKTTPRSTAPAAGDTGAAASPPPTGSPVESFRAALHQARPMLDALLDQAETVRLQDGVLQIAFPTGSDVLRRQAERKENLATLAECARGATGGEVKVRVVGSKGAPPRKAPPSKTTSSPRPAGKTGSATATGKKAREPRRTRRTGEPTLPPDLVQKAESDPGVRKLLHEFGARIVDIRPLDVPREPSDDGGGPAPPEETE